MAALKFGCFVDGVNISDKQLDHAKAQAKKFRVDLVLPSQVSFPKYVEEWFGIRVFQVVWNNESTMYINLFDLFKEHARVLKNGGRYITITGTYPTAEHKSEAVKEIDEFYGCDTHHLKTYSYLAALSSTGLVPVQVHDLTSSIISYWELTVQSTLVNGVEKLFCLNR